jgi:transposase
MNINEDSRLKEFRQLRNTIRGSTEHLIIGIDIAKEKHHAFMGTATGKTLLNKLIFDNTREGFEKLSCHVDAVKTRHALPKVVFGLEPTGDYHKPLAEYLLRQGHTLVLEAGASVRKNRELLDGRWDKHDTKDAANVADLISQGKCLFYEFPSTGLRELRSLLSLKRRLKKLMQVYKVRIRNHLIAQYFPEADDYFRNVEGPPIVKWCLDPRELSALPFEEFARMVLPSKDGEVQRKRLWNIHTKAKTSIGCEATPATSFEAGLLVEALQQLNVMIQDTDRKISGVCKRFPEYACLLTIPGFGPDISAKALGAIGNPHRFENERQVLKMAGLDLSADRSGKKSGAVPVISKRGKEDLRHGLYLAALYASTKNLRFIAYFTNRIKGRERETGIAGKMRIKLAAKLLVIAWTLMKKKEMFNPDCITE